MDVVSGAWGHCSQQQFGLGTSVETLLNSGSSAMIISFDIFRKVRQAAGIL